MAAGWRCVLKTTAGISALAAAALAVLLFLSGCTSLVTDAYDPGRVRSGGAPDEGLEYAGEVSAELVNWNWLFQQDPEQRLELIKQQALEQADEKYGSEAVVKLELLSGRWHPATLLMLFGALGFVEEAEVEASVWLPVEETEAPAAETGFRYRVIPDTDYYSDAEFTKVEYKTAEQLTEELDYEYRSGAISEHELCCKAFQDSGRRNDIRHLRPHRYLECNLKMVQVLTLQGGQKTFQ